MDYSFVEEHMTESFSTFKIWNHTENNIISGCQTGADTLGEQYAISNGMNIIKKHPNWEKFGKAAGPIRNAEMANIADNSNIIPSEIAQNSDIDQLQ